MVEEDRADGLALDGWEAVDDHWGDGAWEGLMVLM